MEKKVKAPKWVGVLGFILILCAPLEDVPPPDFARNVAFYFLFNVPLAAFCFYVTGAFDDLLKR